MNVDRAAPTGAMWALIEEMPPGKASDTGVTAVGDRWFRPESPWRDFPERSAYGGEPHGGKRRFPGDRDPVRQDRPQLGGGGLSHRRCGCVDMTSGRPWEIQ